MTYYATRSEDVVRDFSCPRCDARGQIMFSARGFSSRRGLLNANAVIDAQDAAEVDLRRDADRVLAVVRCPSCGRRPRLALVWPCVRVALWAGFCGALAFVRDVPFWIGVVSAVVLFGGVELWRLQRAARAGVIKLVSVPAARVVATHAAPKPLPKPAAAAPAAAVAAPAPPPRAVEPARPLEPGAEPSLLRTPDD